MKRKHLYFQTAILAVVTSSFIVPQMNAAEADWVVKPIGRFPRGSLAVDSAGRPWIAYQARDDYPSALGLASRGDDGNWTSQIVPGSAGSVNFPHLVFGPDGPTIAHSQYFSSPGFSPFIVQQTGDTWQYERITTGEGSYPSLAYAPSGSATMAYMNHDDRDGHWTLDFAERIGADSWTVQSITLAEYLPSGRGVSLAYDPTSQGPVVGYTQGFSTNAVAGQRTSEARYAYRSGSQWHVEIVDNSSDFVGQRLDLDFDLTGNPSMSYYDSTNDQLRYANRIGPNTWATETVDSSGDVGAFSSLAFFSNGNPMIAYSDYTNDALKVATFDGSIWDIQFVTDSLSAGYYPTLVIDEMDRPLITFQSMMDDGLFYEATILIPEPSAWILAAIGVMTIIRYGRLVH